MAVSFSRIQITADWRQFHSVDLDLSRQVTVLTGANGCGKTTLLTILSNHFGWSLQFVATPHISRKQKKRIFSDLRKLIADDSTTDESTTVGEIRYSNGGVCHLVTPPSASHAAQYQLQYTAQTSVDGVFIPSHRPAATYQAVGSIPTDPKSTQQHYLDFQNLLQQYFLSGRGQNPGMALKQSLISLALFGYGNQAVTPNKEYADLFEQFETVLGEILPENLGFKKIEIRMPDVVLVTRTGDFSLDAMSGGVSSIFSMAWQIHMYGANKEQFTVLIDEPENHLHPSMQRTLLPSVARAFPKCHFIVATHSPFIVTSDPEANVFALTHGAEGRIVSEHLEQADLAASPEKVLRDVLEVPSAVPVWVEEKLHKLLADFESQQPNEATVNRLLEELTRLGLSESIAKIGKI